MPLHGDLSMIIKPHPYFTRYLVGENGSVFSTLLQHEKPREFPLELTPRLSRCGKTRYRVVGLYKDGKRIKKKNSVLVLETFVGPRPNRKVAAHGNGDSLDDRLENLRWATTKENSEDMIKHGRSLIGTKHHNSKLTENDVVEIRMLSEYGVTQRMIAKEYGVSQKTVCQAIYKQTWRHVT